MFSFIIQHSPLLYLTQSLWRDEVYSLFMAAKPVSFFISHLTFEPPFYYILLHFWEKIFGMSEIAGRSLSLVAFTGATVIVIFWAEKLFKNHWLSWWLPVFFFFNPMLLYYGMELRTYGWYIFFATLSLYAYCEKKWALWVAATVLGFYTHTFLVIVPFAQTVHYFATHKIKFDAFGRSLLVLAVAALPWMVKIAMQAGQLKSTWYFPVNFNLATSALGNVFLGYEGTPWYLWGFTKFISLLLVLASFAAVTSKKTRHSSGIFLSQVYLPMILVIGISFIKPFYVNRYMIAVPVAEVFIVALALYAIKNPAVQKTAAALCLLFILAFNVWYPGQHAKTDIRKTLTDVNNLTTPNDILIADNPLIIFETMYYTRPGTRVYLFNPHNNPFPPFVGEGLVRENQMIEDFPSYPARAFFIHQNGTFDIVYKRV